MKLITDFFKLVRWPNLVFIALTQLLVFYALAEPVLFEAGAAPREQQLLLWVLIVSSVLIAAAGYVINDYFDLNIDIVNKPARMVVDRSISRRWAIFLHFSFSVAGILMGFYIGLQNGNWFIGFANLVCVVVLWFYSTTFKKQLLIGNVLISLLTAWVVMVVYFFAMSQAYQHQGAALQQLHTQKLMRLALLYSAFAFLITIIREVVKDIEDLEGDRRYGCKTMPIVWGVAFSKVFAISWTIVLLVLLLVVSYYVMHLHMWVPLIYNLVLIAAPTAYCLFLLVKASATVDFSLLSKWIKAVMLMGILSMLLFKFFG